MRRHVSCCGLKSTPVPRIRDRKDSGARRTEVRWILGGRRRSDPPRRSTHCRDQEAGQRRCRGGLGDGRHHRRLAGLGSAGVPGAAGPRAGHASDGGGAHLQCARGDGDRITRRPGPLIHRLPGRCRHHRHPRQREDHRCHADPPASRARRRADRLGRRLPGGKPGHPGRHHAGSRRLRHHGGRPGRRTQCRRLRDLYRRGRHLHRGPTYRAATPASWTPSPSRKCSRWRPAAPRF